MYGTRERATQNKCGPGGGDLGANSKFVEEEGWNSNGDQTPKSRFRSTADREKVTKKGKKKIFHQIQSIFVEEKETVKKFGRKFFAGVETRNERAVGKGRGKAKREMENFRNVLQGSEAPVRAGEGNHWTSMGWG